jgi:entericidin B
MKALISLAAVAAVAATLSGCNTVAGMGKDVSAGGQGVTNAAYSVKHEYRQWRHRHDSDYEAARTACAGTTSGERDACYDRVRADYRTRMAEARTRYNREQMRAENDVDRQWDTYERARDTCYELRGAEEDRCIADVRSKRPQ